MTELKPWLVDVPVQFHIWTRPECQKLQWDVIREARPSKLFVVSDGGRNEEEWALINQNRTLIDEGIDWECEVHKLYSDKNYGMYQNTMNAYEYIWARVDRCIFLEDDVAPSVSFFRFCAELLEKYKDDTRICMIAGQNFLGTYDRPDSDYFFTRQLYGWGFATWKRVYDNYYNFDYGKSAYAMDLLEHATKENHHFFKKIKAYATQEYYQGHKAFDEFFLEFTFYGFNQMAIVPTRNMIHVTGATESSTHFTDMHKLPKAVQNMFFMKRYEYDFPLKHPKYVIPDYYYENRIHEIRADKGALNKTKRFIETKYLYIKNGGNIIYGAKRIINRKLSSGKELES